MEIETAEEERGTLIKIRSESEIALVVSDRAGERIYLPPPESSGQSYYVDEISSLERTPEGYQVIHPRQPEDIKVLN